jgi:hypothetical protein
MKLIWLFLRSVWNALLHASGWAVPLLGLAFVFSVLAALLRPVEWEFSIDASSDVVEISVPASPETFWRIDGAVVCQRGSSGGSSVCGGRRWVSKSLADVREPVLVLGGSADSEMRPALNVTVEALADGEVRASVRSDESGQRVGWLRGDGIDNAELMSPLNLVWPGTDRDGAATGRELVWPFSAELTIGRDVNWADPRLARKGQIIVYSPSGESVSRRSSVAEASLMPGDQVRLLATGTDSERIWPKGFLRFDSPGEGSAGAIDVVAYGAARSVLIERFGDKGFDFRPGWWARLVNDNRVVILFALLSGLLAFRGSYAEGAQTPVESWHELRSAWRAYWGRHR